MMKNLVVTNSISRNAGGLFESVRRLSQVINTDFDVDVVVYGCADQFSNEDIDKWNPLIPYALKTVGPKTFSYAPDLLPAMIQLQPDIVHCHGIWTYFSFANLLHSSRTKTPYLISPHGMLDPWAVRNSHWKKIIAGQLYEKRHLGKAACLRALCESEAQSMRQYGLKNPICIIPNGIDLVETDDFVSSPWQDKEDDGKKIILYLGRIHPKKGLENLLKAWSQLKDAGREWTLVIAGWDQGGHENELKTLARDLAIDGCTLFVGPQFGEDKAAAYHHADAFVLPSFSEGLPMVVLEAWAHSLPVLMTEYCNLPEGFTAEAALRINPDPEGIRQGLQTLISMNQNERDSMGRQGNALVRERFVWHKIGAELMSVYDWILGDTLPPESMRFY